jgi:hypothetical protein
MKIFTYMALSLAIAVAGCGNANNDEAVHAIPANASTAPASDTKPEGKRGGSITVGDKTWNFVPSTQCSVYPGPVVSISGHAKEDPTVEILIDWGGPNGVQVGKDGTDTSWHAVPDSIAVAIDGQHVKGTASFATSSYSTDAVAEGSFDIECGY